jgi:hypothetical protein
MRRSDATMTIHTTGVGRLGAPVANDDGAYTKTIRRAGLHPQLMQHDGTVISDVAIVAASG